MSVPPPDGWQPPPQQSGPPPNRGQPYGQAGYFSQQPPHGWQQGNWPQSGPFPSPKVGNSLKWLLLGVAVLLVVGISVGATLIFTRDTNSGSTTPHSGITSDYASADDMGPASIITDEPTCKTFLNINNSLGDVQRNGWSDARGTLGPAAEWTTDQRSQTQAVASSMRTASDQVAPLAKQTPHRVVRELYEQFIAYGHAYADSIANYVPQDDNLASANINISATLFGICESIEYGSASRSISVTPPTPPTGATKPQDTQQAEPFITTSDGSCAAWSTSADKFNASTSEWQKLDPNNPGQWSPEQRAQQQAAMPFVSTWAQDMEAVGRQSGNPVLEDFATTAAVYLQGYVSAGDSYVGADGWLRYVAYKINQTVLSACNAVEG